MPARARNRGARPRAGGSLALACLVALTAPGLSAQTGGDPFSGDVVLRTGDVLRIRVWPDSTLSGDFLVEETGSIQLPGIGDVTAAGRAVSAIRTELREHYAQVMRAPVVTISPLFRVSVVGAVQRPGLFQVDPTHNIFDAISLAGGFGESAAESRVRLVRGSEVYTIDAEASMDGGRDVLSLPLRSGDRIVVPRSGGLGWRDVVLIVQTLVVVWSVAAR